MGTCSWQAENARKLQSPVTSYPHPIDVQIVHCGTEIGIPEANRISYVIKRVFPNANITRSCPGVTKNITVYYEGDIVFDRQADGYLSDQTEDYLMDKLKTMVGAGEVQAGKFLATDQESDSL